MQFLASILRGWFAPTQRDVKAPDCVPPIVTNTPPAVRASPTPEDDITSIVSDTAVSTKRKSPNGALPRVTADGQGIIFNVKIPREPPRARKGKRYRVPRDAWGMRPKITDFKTVLRRQLWLIPRGRSRKGLRWGMRVRPAVFSTSPFNRLSDGLPVFIIPSAAHRRPAKTPENVEQRLSNRESFQILLHQQVPRKRKTLAEYWNMESHGKEPFSYPPVPRDSDRRQNRVLPDEPQERPAKRCRKLGPVSRRDALPELEQPHHPLASPTANADYSELDFLSDTDRLPWGWHAFPTTPRPFAKGLGDT